MWTKLYNFDQPSNNYIEVSKQSFAIQEVKALKNILVSGAMWTCFAIERCPYVAEYNLKYNTILSNFHLKKKQSSGITYYHRRGTLMIIEGELD